MRIVICAGHDGATPGNTWNNYREAELMLDLRDIVAAKLRALGHEVIEDGEDGVNKPLSEAMRLARGVEIAVELHTNANSNTKARGVEVIAQAKDKRLAQDLAQRIAGVLGTITRRDGGFFEFTAHSKERGFRAGFVREGGVIVEVFFQSNQSELTAYLSRKDVVADAIAHSLDLRAKGEL